MAEWKREELALAKQRETFQATESPNTATLPFLLLYIFPKNSMALDAAKLSTEDFSIWGPLRE